MFIRWYKLKKRKKMIKVDFLTSASVVPSGKKHNDLRTFIPLIDSSKNPEIVDIVKGKKTIIINPIKDAWFRLNEDFVQYFPKSHKNFFHLIENSEEKVFTSPNSLIDFRYLLGLNKFLMNKKMDGCEIKIFKEENLDELKKYATNEFPFETATMENDIDDWMAVPDIESDMQSLCKDYYDTFGAKKIQFKKEDMQCIYIRRYIVQNTLRKLAEQARTCFSHKNAQLARYIISHVITKDKKHVSLQEIGDTPFQYAILKAEQQEPARPVAIVNYPSVTEFFGERYRSSEDILDAILNNWSKSNPAVRQNIRNHLLEGKNLENLFFSLFTESIPPVYLLQIFLNNDGSREVLYENVIKRLEKYFEMDFRKDFLNFSKSPNISNVEDMLKRVLALHNDHTSDCLTEIIQNKDKFRDCRKKLANCISIMRNIIAEENGKKIFCALPEITGSVQNFENGPAGCNLSTALNMLAEVDPEFFHVNDNERNSLRGLIAHYIEAARRFKCKNFNLLNLSMHITVSTSYNFGFTKDGSIKTEDTGEILQEIFNRFGCDSMSMGQKSFGELPREKTFQVYCFRAPGDSEKIVIYTDAIRDADANSFLGLAHAPQYYEMEKTMELTRDIATFFHLPTTKKFDSKWQKIKILESLYEKGNLFLDYLKQYSSYSKDGFLSEFDNFKGVFRSIVEGSHPHIEYGLPSKNEFEYFLKCIRSYNEFSLSNVFLLIERFPWIEAMTLFDKSILNDTEDPLVSSTIISLENLNSIYEYCCLFDVDSSIKIFDKGRADIKELTHSYLNLLSLQGLEPIVNDQTNEENRILRCLNFIKASENLLGKDEVDSILPELDENIQNSRICAEGVDAFLGKDLYIKVQEHGSAALKNQLLKSFGVHRHLRFRTAFLLNRLLRLIYKNTPIGRSLKDTQKIPCIAAGARSNDHYVSFRARPNGKWVCGDMKSYRVITDADKKTRDEERSVKSAFYALGNSP